MSRSPGRESNWQSLGQVTNLKMMGNVVQSLSCVSAVLGPILLRNQWEQPVLEGHVWSLLEAESPDVRASRSRECLVTEKMELCGWASLLDFRLNQINFVTNYIILCQRLEVRFQKSNLQGLSRILHSGFVCNNAGEALNIHLASNDHPWASLVAQWYRIHLPMGRSFVEEMTTHSSIFAWKSHGQRSLVSYSR